ncbi:MAG: hypothetical protein ABR915_23135 [Thermoguttaceae bacterium]|jgi:hypothetical protein
MTRRRLRLTPDRCVLSLLAAEALLGLSDRLGWPAWHKGYAVLAAVASVGLFFLLMLLWFGAALVFRWRFQFSIRSLLVLTVAVALPCRWLAAEMRRAEKQSEAVKAIGGWGSVIYRGNPQSGLEPPGPPWLRNVLGDDFLADVLLASVHDDAAMQHLKHLTGLETLWLTVSGNDDELGPVNDAGLEHLEELDQLKELMIYGSRISEAALRHIGNLSGLRELDLFEARITGEGLRHIGKLTKLESLNLGNVQITDRDLGHLQALAQLQWLSLEGTGFTPAGLSHLTGLSRLTVLYVSGEERADGRWAHAALPYLANFTKLTFLWVDGLSGEDVKKLRAALPNCDVNVPQGMVGYGGSSSSPTSFPTPPAKDGPQTLPAPDQPGG